MPLGQPVQHRLEVGSTQIGRRTGQQIAPVIFVVLIAVEALLTDALGFFNCNEVIVERGKGSVHLSRIGTFAQRRTEIICQLLRGAVGIGIKCFILAPSGFIPAEINLPGVAAVGAFFVAGHKNLP